MTITFINPTLIFSLVSGIQGIGAFLFSINFRVLGSANGVIVFSSLHFEEKAKFLQIQGALITKFHFNSIANILVCLERVTESPLLHDLDAWFPGPARKAYSTELMEGGNIRSLLLPQFLRSIASKGELQLWHYVVHVVV